MDHARIFNDSYERVMHGGATSTGFYPAFYNLLIATSPEAEVKFRNTDKEAQYRMLHASVAVLLAYFGTDHESDYLLRLAERHSRSGVDIGPEFYSVWLDCLVETVRQFDPKFTPEVEAAWRVVFAKGIAFMTSRYEGRSGGGEKTPSAV